MISAACGRDKLSTPSSTDPNPRLSQRDICRYSRDLPRIRCCRQGSSERHAANWRNAETAEQQRRSVRFCNGRQETRSPLRQTGSKTAAQAVHAECPCSCQTNNWPQRTARQEAQETEIPDG